MASVQTKLTTINPPQPFQFKDRYKSQFYRLFLSQDISLSTFRRRVKKSLGEKHYQQILSNGDQLKYITDHGAPSGYYLTAAYGKSGF